MNSVAKKSVVFVCAGLLLNGCGQEAEQAHKSPDTKVSAGAATDSKQLLAEALSATYPSHGASARVVDWEGRVLQEGTSGFTCMPTPPALAVGDITAPMCLDEVWMTWADAWQNRKPFATDRVGIAYMLAGDSGASNIDPYAEGPTEDNEWIVEGPHLMILSPDPALLEAFPTDPSSGGPYVMWRGTDYAHVMVPVKVPELTPAADSLADALSAADTAMQATVAAMDWSGTMLKEGESGYTCMPTPPDYASGRSPMCFDQTWMAWGDAWQNRKPFQAERIGISYMLAGDEGASNIDPFAAGPAPENQWVVEGPHLMLLAPDPAMLAGISRDPGQGGPYVMWDGTPYAHVMIPVVDRE